MIQNLKKPLHNRDALKLYKINLNISSQQSQPIQTGAFKFKFTFSQQN